ncbi:MAG TPA: 50S ribosomal protein L19 [Spirochaetia bacterium]|nr:MAG: 50S ribosomal protein L19 [Spirochaetes bacterium GWB1_36_13]HCL57567.1 50S ribosomal protein L19 [Spirochaetia bacterium]
MGINAGQLIHNIEEQYKIRDINFGIGNTVKVFTKIIEGKRERIQIFEGTVIAIQGKDSNKTFKVRKMVGNIGVERNFPLQSRNIQKIEVVKIGKVRRSKLYFLRDRIGKKTQLETVMK